jgi:hypothetical protein
MISCHHTSQSTIYLLAWLALTAFCRYFLLPGDAGAFQSELEHYPGKYDFEDLWARSARQPRGSCHPPERFTSDTGRCHSRRRLQNPERAPFCDVGTISSTAAVQNLPDCSIAALAQAWHTYSSQWRRRAVVASAWSPTRDR